MNIVIDTAIIDRYESAITSFESLLSQALEREEVLRRRVEADAMLTISQAREYLGGISEDTLLYYRRHGLDYYKKGREGVWYRKADIDAWVASGKVTRHGR